MCVTPNYLPNVGMVACRNCWQCRNNRVNDLVGRCIAEQHVSDGVLAVTLTYKGDTVSAATLIYSDFQKFMKRLRKAGYTVRYIVAGEYGSKKGRAHWHAILFFQGKVPEVELNKRVDWEFWEDGFSFFQRPDYGGFKYVLKYVLKDDKDLAKASHLAMSKQPPLGYKFFMDLAEAYVEQGLSPQNPRYAFRDQFDDDGKRRHFWLQGRMRELFIERFIDLFRARHARDYPYSEFVEEMEDKFISADRVWTDEEWLNWLAGKKPPRPPAEPDYWREDEDGKPYPAWITGYVPLPQPQWPDMLIVRYSDGTADIHDGDNQAWRVRNVDEAKRVFEILNQPWPHNVWRFKER